MRYVNRRSFLQLVPPLGMMGIQAGMGLLTAAKAHAQPQMPPVVRLAHLSQRQGSDVEMAAYAIMGAQLGAEEADVTAGMFGSKVELIVEAATSPENIVSLAEKLGAREKLAAIIVALDDLGTARLSEVTRQRRVLCLNTVARGDVLRGGKCQRLMFHVEPDIAMYTHAMGQWLVQQNRRRWRFIVSEAVHGPEVYFRGRRFVQQHSGIDLGRSVIAPGQADYSEALALVARGDAEAVVVALSGADLRRFLEQYKASGLTTLLAGIPLDILTLWHAGPQSLQGIWVTSWYHQLERYSARELNRRFLRRFDKPAEGYAWANWAAVKVVVEGVLRSTSTDPTALVNYLEAAPPFDGHKGKSLTFREWNHQLRQPLYILKARDTQPKDLRDLLELSGEVPAPGTPGKSVVEVLDTLGEPRAESSCRLEAL